MSTYRSKTIRYGILAAGFTLAMTVSGCVTLPVDPEGTLDTVRSQALRVGLSPNNDLVDVQGTEYSGSEVTLAKEFASHLQTETEFTLGGEEALVKQLENGELDMVIGGISSKTPWSKQVGVTRPYLETVDVIGEKEKLIILVPPGENAFLSELEYFLDQTQKMP